MVLDVISLYFTRCDERNYCEVIRPTFAKIYTFPTNYTVPGRLQRAALVEVWARFGETASPNEIESKLNRQARECMLALSERLGKISRRIPGNPIDNKPLSCYFEKEKSEANAKFRSVQLSPMVRSYQNSFGVKIFF